MLAENNIVIVGGGFAGTTQAQALEKRTPHNSFPSCPPRLAWPRHAK
ncbi:hypothetical protein [Cupriavidus oxalaticus]|jgi:hypothetical protein|nr:hypothetical protein [Cupriavidus oxalaticus]